MKSALCFSIEWEGGDDTLQKRCTSVDIKLIDRMGDYAIAKQFKTARL